MSKKDFKNRFETKYGGVIVFAIQWNGDNYNEIEEFINDDKKISHSRQDNAQLIIKTSQGLTYVSITDYIVKVDGNFYRCMADLFSHIFVK